MSDIKEFEIDSRDHFSKSMYLTKFFLKDNKKIKLIGKSHNASQTAHVAEALKRLGYVEFDDIKTETGVINNTRQVKLVITMHNTPDFDKLYKENEEKRNKIIEEKKKSEPETKGGK